MKRKLMITLLLLAALPVAAQKLIVEQTTVDVGRTGYEHPITAIFKCRNKSGKKLRISQVKPDCYCVAADYPKGEIGGNEQFQIQLTYNARQLGHFNQQAVIVSNASSAFSISLSIDLSQGCIWIILASGIATFPTC